jgi:hypothetical protein
MPTERIEKIYAMRQELNEKGKPKYSYDKIGKEFGITRERVRQLLAKRDRLKRWYAEAKKVAPYFDFSNITRMDQFIPPLVSIRTTHAIRNGVPPGLSVQEFIDLVDPAELLAIPNCGVVTVKELFGAIKEAGYDVSNIRTPRYGKNYNTVKYGGGSPLQWYVSKYNCIPSLHTKSSK